MKKDTLDSLSLSRLRTHREEGVPFDYIRVDNNRELMLSACSPLMLEDGGMLLCLEGECEIEVNFRTHAVRSHDLLLCFPRSIVQVKSKSPDFQGSMMAVSTSFTRKLNIPSVASFYLFIRDNPCVSLDDGELASLQELFGLLVEKSRSEHPYRSEIASHLMMMICYEIAGVYQRYRPDERRAYTRQDSMLEQFLSLVVSDYHVSREVAYYADKMCITPKYLSLVVKRASGKSAAAWINDTVILNAKSLLKGTQLTIQQIADRLNFPNPSFFGQYFRRHTGLTPKAYRYGK